ncbi:zinc transporter [Blastocystis sp. subtype 4]|uniref:zinc transporter n=1 Tax=Blastocystis sp. subtype 4 TaxID=944170 RepID=UPI0007113643|nr:zinc transporter [Blastocystis sp. subtype 4]KNB44139.1 zinc transporter [Blastocystis sp. subtype 4]|eukprot:XP_014527587.1 zinc transporter [Blastocystis sp. subtype 4]
MWAKPVEIVDDFTEADAEGHILRVNGKPFVEYLAVILDKGVDIRDIEIADKDFYLNQLKEKEVVQEEIEMNVEQESDLLEPQTEQLSESQPVIEEEQAEQCGLTPSSCKEPHTHSHNHHRRASSEKYHVSLEIQDEYKHPYLAIALTTVSAMAASVGGAFVVFFWPPSSTLLGLMLAFSAGIMLYVGFLEIDERKISYMDIMVHAQMDLSMGEANIWMFIGMIGFLLITWLIPDDIQSEPLTKRDRSLEIAGLITALGISLHNFPEGLVVYNATVVGVCDLAAPSSFSLSYLVQYLVQCTGRGLVVALAIAIHNIPEGIAVALPLYYSTHSKWEAMKWCLLSSICEPLAAIVFGIIFSEYLTERLMAVMNAVVAGIMIILCVFELIPTALKYTSESGSWDDRWSVCYVRFTLFPY